MESQTFVFFGIVGSGKGTQVKLLMDYLKAKDGKECVYVGTGEIFRKIIQSKEKDPSIEATKEILNSGKLMPDSNTNEVVAKAVMENLAPDKSLLFDGYPRTVPQSEYFENLMKSIQRENIKIIYIELSKEEAMTRNLLRGRQDDTQEGLAKRFEEYENKVIPAMKYFQGKSGYTIYTVNGEQTMEKVHEDIIKALEF